MKIIGVGKGAEPHVYKTLPRFITTVFPLDPPLAYNITPPPVIFQQILKFKMLMEQNPNNTYRVELTIAKIIVNITNGASCLQSIRTALHF